MAEDPLSAGDRLIAFSIVLMICGIVWWVLLS